MSRTRKPSRAARSSDAIMEAQRRAHEAIGVAKMADWTVKNPPETKARRVWSVWDERGVYVPTREERFRAEWARLVGLWNVYMANRQEGVAPSEKGEPYLTLAREAFVALSSAMRGYGLGDVSALARAHAREPLSVVELLAPRVILKEQPTDHEQDAAYVRARLAAYQAARARAGNTCLRCEVAIPVGSQYCAACAATPPWRTP